MRSLAAALFIVLLLVPPEPARAARVEDIFRDASTYTVQIQTETTLPFKEDEKGTANGAGFLVDRERGWIMTNAHVASYSPSDVSVAFRDQDYQEARRLYVDPYIDVAILEIPAAAIPDGAGVAPLDCGDLPEVGLPVGAYGHPWGFAYTGTRGIISGVTGKYGTEDLQTDAPINAGNSGGPLISLRTGKVVAISMATLDEKGAQNTNFAVPMKYACRILGLLREGRDPSPADLGATFMDFLDGKEKVVIARIFPKPGAVDLRVGDVIERVEGVPHGDVDNEGELIHLLRGRLSSVRIAVERGGKAMTVSGTLPPAERVTDRRGVYCSGLLFADAGYRDAETLETPLMVHHVEPGTDGDAAEIDSFDLLVTIDGQRVKTVDDLYRHLSEASKRKKRVTLVLKRHGDATDPRYTYLQREIPVEGLKEL